MPRLCLLFAAALFATTVGCASDKREAVAGPAKGLRLSGVREPFTFSSWDIDRVEWSATSPMALPPDVSAVLADRTVLPIRGLTLAQARRAAGLKVGPPAKADDGRGQAWADATPAAGSGFRFDFVGGRLVHFVATPVKQPDGGSVDPVFENHAAVDRDVNGDVRQYPVPLDHDTCVHLFGDFDGLETDLAVPAVLPG